MARRKDYEKLSRRERQNRYFSEDFKRKKVSEIDRNISKVSEIAHEYQVSTTAIYKWIYKYSEMRQKGVKQVIETRSDTRKIKNLKQKVKELERIIGQKQLLIDFQQTAIELTEEEYKIDIKKKYGGKLYYTSGITEKKYRIK